MASRRRVTGARERRVRVGQKRAGGPAPPCFLLANPLPLSPRRIDVTADGLRMGALGAGFRNLLKVIAVPFLKQAP